jgi:hypothetical protein
MCRFSESSIDGNLLLCSFAKIDDIPNVSDENIGELVSEWTVPWVSIPGGERVYHKESARALIEDYKSLPPDDADAVYDLQSGWKEWKKSWVVVSSSAPVGLPCPDKYLAPIVPCPM